MAQQAPNPSSTQSFPITPLNQGMILDQVSTQIPPNACLQSANFVVTRYGPKRRPGTQTFNSTPVDYPPIQDVVTYWDLAGQLKTLVIDSKFVYTANATTFTGYYWTYKSGTLTVTTGSDVVSGSGTDFTGSTADLKAGDVLVVDTAGSAAELVIENIDGATSLTLLNNSTVNFTGTNFEIRRAWGIFDNGKVDWTIYHDPTDGQEFKQVVFADGVRRLRAWNGTSLALFGTNDMIVNCVAAWSGVGKQDRLFTGRSFEGSYDWRQRIRWTDPTDPTKIPVGAGSNANNFLDMPYVRGHVRRLVPLGGMLVAYFSDSIWIGRPTNRSDLPVLFDKIDTGGMGLVGTKAVCSWIDSHYFVMQDGIYRLSPSDGIQEIGTPVLRQTIETCSAPHNIYVTQDPASECILFGFPEDAETISKVWRFNYKAGAWSYDDLNVDFIGYTDYSLASTIDEETTSIDLLEGRFDDTAPFEQRVFFGYGGQLSYYNSARTTDVESQPIEATFVTKDFDFGIPDQRKTIFRVSLKIDRTLTSDLTFATYVSMDRGTTYYSVGNLVIPAGDDENFVNFIKTGSTVRVKFVTEDVIEQYQIMDVVLKVKGRGGEMHLGNRD